MLLVFEDGSKTLSMLWQWRLHGNCLMSHITWCLIFLHSKVSSVASLGSLWKLTLLSGSCYCTFRILWYCKCIQVADICLYSKVFELRLFQQDAAFKIWKSADFSYVFTFSSGIVCTERAKQLGSLPLSPSFQHQIIWMYTITKVSTENNDNILFNINNNPCFQMKLLV